MIIEFFLNPIFSIINFFISLIPTQTQSSQGFNILDFVDILAQAFVFFPFTLFLTCISTISFWLTAHMVWAIVEWVYKKLPGIS